MFSWLIEIVVGMIPVWFWPVLAALGLAANVAANVLTNIPYLKMYKWPIEIAGFAAFVIGIFMWGGSGVNEFYQARIKEMQDKIAVAEQQSQQVNTVIETKVVEHIKYVDRQVKVRDEQIDKDREAIDKDCKVPEIAIQDYNAALADPDTKPDAKKKESKK